MSINCKTAPARIGLCLQDPIRIEGLLSFFEELFTRRGQQFLPVAGPLESLLRTPRLQFLIADLPAAQHQAQSILDTVRNTRPEMQLIAIGPQGHDRLAQQAILSGARAWLEHTATPEEIHEALLAVSSGSIWAPSSVLARVVDQLLISPTQPDESTKPRFTAREQQVLDLLLMACSNREIAERMGLEERTIKNYVGSILRKTSTANRIELTMLMLQTGQPATNTQEAERFVPEAVREESLAHQ